MAVDVLRVPGVRAVVALVDGDFDLGSFGMRLPRMGRRRNGIERLPRSGPLPLLQLLSPRS